MTEGSERLILNDLVPIHWGLGGAAIGILTLGMLYFAKRRLGVSTGLESVCSLALNAPYFRRASLRESTHRRIALLVGLVIGGLLSASLSGGVSPTWDMGPQSENLGLSEAGKTLWMFAGGLFIGFGTRLAGGCTSGHGIFGISNMERSGLVSTLSFMAAGVATSHITYRLLWVA